METRMGKVSVGAAGGTAGKGAKTYKVSLPSAWVHSLALEDADREVELTLDGDSIVIRKRRTLEDFAREKRAMGHDVRKFMYYDRDQLCSLIVADFSDESLRVENYTRNVVKTAFGVNDAPTWGAFQDFLEERCIPRQREGLREYLEAIGVDRYEPLEIIQKTEGRMAEDGQWLRMEEIA